MGLLKKLVIGAAVGVGTITVAPLALGAVATVAGGAGMYGVGSALFTGAIELLSISSSTAAAGGAIAGAVVGSREEKIEHDTAVKTRVEDSNEFAKIEKQHKQEYEDKYNKKVKADETIINKQAEKIMKQEELINILAKEDE